jgi:hypothetical protein
MKINLFLFVALSVAILGCSNNPINISKEQSVQSVATLSSGCTQSAAMIAWEKLSQATKDSKILNLAASEVGKYNTHNTGQCYGWVSYIVLTASSQAVQIPAYYSDNMSMWKDSPCMPVYGRSTMVENCVPGDIIQMYWNVRTARATATTPAKYEVTQHTAFFKSGNATQDGLKGFWMLDCNFVPPATGSRNNYISTHFVAYSDFYAFTTPTSANPKLGYNVYHIQ